MATTGPVMLYGISDFMNSNWPKIKNAIDNAVAGGHKDGHTEQGPKQAEVDLSTGVIDTEFYPEFCDNPANLKSLAITARQEIRQYLVSEGYADRVNVEIVTVKSYVDSPTRRSLHMIILLREIA